jgi:hypothetical protein
MSKTKKRPPAPSPKTSKDNIADYGKSYVRLRTMLDAMEIVALTYYWDAETAAEKNKRAAELAEMIMPMITHFKKGLTEECPAGLNNCGGCCVPYRCPRME